MINTFFPCLLGKKERRKKRHVLTTFTTDSCWTWIDAGGLAPLWWAECLLDLIIYTQY
jgi:hypothetical protein